MIVEWIELRKYLINFVNGLDKTERIRAFEDQSAGSIVIQMSDALASMVSESIKCHIGRMDAALLDTTEKEKIEESGGQNDALP